MRRLFVALTSAVSVVALTHMASAADLYQPVYKALPPAPPPFSWTGFYVGVAGGAGWGTVESEFNSITFNSATFTANTPWSQDEINGWTVGGTVGYNWQANPWLVLGVEGDWDWADLEGTTPCGLVNIFSCHTKVDWTADVAGRVGFTWDRALIYAKGGVAWAHSDYNTSLPLLADIGAPIPNSLDFSDTRVGGLFGAGIEYAFLPNWSAKIEYDFMDFGTKTYNNTLFSCGASGTCASIAPDLLVTSNSSIRETISTVKFGVNYRFWGY